MSLIKNILLIDDDEDDREIFIEALHGLDAAVQTYVALNGADGLQHLLSSKLLPNMIFLDLNMPVMNGREFLGRIKSLEGLRDIPVVILSTSSDSRTIRETKQLGAQDFITKPDEFKLWGKALKRFLSDLS